MSLHFMLWGRSVRHHTPPQLPLALRVNEHPVFELLLFSLPHSPHNQASHNSMALLVSQSLQTPVSLRNLALPVSLKVHLLLLHLHHHHLYPPHLKLGRLKLQARHSFRQDLLNRFHKM